MAAHNILWHKYLYLQKSIDTALHTYLMLSNPF